MAATRFSRTNAAMFSIAVVAAAWQVALAVTVRAADAGTARTWAKIACACMVFIAPAVYQFVASILRPARHRRIVSRLGWLAAAQFAVLTLTTDYVVTGVRRLRWGFGPTHNTVARAASLLLFGGLLL